MRHRTGEAAKQQAVGTFCVAFFPEAGSSLIVFWAVTPTCGWNRLPSAGPGPPGRASGRSQAPPHGRPSAPGWPCRLTAVPGELAALPGPPSGNPRVPGSAPSLPRVRRARRPSPRQPRPGARPPAGGGASARRALRLAGSAPGAGLGAGRARNAPGRF